MGNEAGGRAGGQVLGLWGLGGPGGGGGGGPPRCLGWVVRGRLGMARPCRLHPGGTTVRQCSLLSTAWYC
jgi:hypothetical protein